MNIPTATEGRCKASAPGIAVPPPDAASTDLDAAPLVRPAHPRQGWRWPGAMLAWLLGVAWQLRQAELGPPWHDAVAAGLVLVLLGCAWRWCGTVRAACWVVAGLLLGALVAQGQARLGLAQALPLALEGRNLQLTGVVASLPQAGPQGSSFLFEVDADSLPVLRQAHKADAVMPSSSSASPSSPRRLALAWYSAWDGEEVGGASAPPTVRAGERWRLTVRLRRPHALSNPAGFDRELHLFEQGVRATGSVRRGERLQVDAGHPVERWRQRVRDGIEATVPDPRAAGVLAALAVGDQGAIEPGDWDVFRAAGVAHLMSISGLHVTMFAWLAALAIGWLWRLSPWAMRVCPTPWAARWGGCLAAAGYALFSGGGVPAQRTVGMLVIVTLLHGSGRRWPWPWVLLAAAVVVTAFDPWALLQAGFWLSFMAVALLMLGAGEAGDKPAGEAAHQAPRSQSGPGLADRSSANGAMPSWRRRGRALFTMLGRSAREGLRTQWVATWGLAPLSLVFFQQVSVVGLLANLVAIPLVTLVVTPLALLGVLWPGCWQAGAWLVQQLSLGLGWLAAWPMAVWTVPVAPGWAQWGGLVAGVLWMARLPWTLRALALPLVLPLLWPPAVAPPEGQFSVLAADVGQGTSVLVQTRRHLLLFDAGPVYSKQGDAGQRVLLPVLQALGHARIDRLVLSHRDTDHVGGAPALLRGLPVDSLWSSIEASHPVLAEARSLGVPLQDCVAGQRWRWDGVDFEVLHPLSPPLPLDASEVAAGRKPPRPNARSCVLRVGNGQVSLLLTGDIEKAQEAALVEALGPDGLSSTVLMVPHHGSRTSSTPAFLDAVRPSLAVVQSGHRNRFGHPAPQVLARYRERGIALRVSPSCGAWRWRSDAPARAALCERQARRRYWHDRPEGSDDPDPGAVGDGG